MNVITAANQSSRGPRFAQVAVAISKSIFILSVFFTKLNFSFVFLGIRQVGKAPRSGRGIHRFEPCIPNY